MLSPFARLERIKIEGPSFAGLLPGDHGILQALHRSLLFEQSFDLV